MSGSARNGSLSQSPALNVGEQESGAMPEQHDRSESHPQPNGKGGAPITNGQKPASASSNAKDPLRPRRKKAKRACFACQRAHLTCGDERPCQRCIKRGLQDACQDGVRKKAKYLHDAPNEALAPGIRGNIYAQPNSARSHLAVSRNGSNSTKPQDTSSDYYSQQQSNTYNAYPQTKPQGEMAPPALQENTINPASFSGQSPVSPTYTNMTDSASQNPALSSTLSQPGSATGSVPSSQAQNPFGSAFFDPSDPALFNFDIASMNFGNHYGALEFGMLGHMATGAGDTPPSDTAAGQRGSIGRNGSGTFVPPGTANSNFEGSGGQPFLFNDPVLSDWSQNPANSRNIYNQNLVPGHMSEGPHAFAIESGPANFTSPSSTESPQMTTSPTFDDTNNAPTITSRNLMPPNAPRQQARISTPHLKYQGLHVGVKRRHRNPSTIYDSVREPYSYTSGFHSLTAFIQRRFSPQKTLQIAKALASIRPSFIATTKTLNQDDLVFMEKCFQRTLWEYEDFINACGTPTIVCRRTGEIAAVGKEFSILTGWKKEVLLGKEPNLNINTGGAGGASGASSRGSYTPRIPTQETTPGRTQPVFLAELLDDDSVIEFYEDFAKLAFGDSRGSVMTTCKLLKYKTKEDSEMLKVEGDNTPGGSGANANANGAATNGQSQSRKWDKGGIAGEAGMNQLGFRDGKVECSYCWTVKRDVFDIPMLIVMNFLPCI